MKALALLALLASPATAQDVCGDRETALRNLADKYGETQQSFGYAPVVGGNGYILEIYANLETGTWTVLGTMADGNTCMIAHGNDWQVTPQGEAI